jgi:hypothetical protein
MRTFFELEDDLYNENRWHLNGLFDCNRVKLDSREFTYGVRVALGPPLIAKLWKEGTKVNAYPPFHIAIHTFATPLDFTFNTSNAPVVTSKVASILMSVSTEDMQTIPVTVGLMPGRYDIINVVSVVDCIDTIQSEIDWWERDNDIRPDKAGMPRLITKLIIDPKRVGNHHIFRPKGWTGVIIVSDVIKKGFEDASVSGVRFRPV